MKLVKFRITNYKSIIDSGDCYVSDGMTIFAGKNESGKTSILEALADFDANKSIREEAHMINQDPDEGSSPQIIVTFCLKKEEILTIFDAMGLPIQKIESDQSNYNITIAKKCGEGKDYQIVEDCFVELGITENERGEISNLPNTVESQILQIINSDDRLSNFIEPYRPTEGDTVSKYVELIAQAGESLVANTSIDEETRLFLMKKLNEISEKFQDSANDLKPHELRELFLDHIISNYLPNFILFSSFNDRFPDSINVNEIENNEWASDLAIVSNFKKQLITSDNKQTRKNNQDDVNADFTKQFQKFWTQEKITLTLERDGNELNFWIKEGGVSFPPSKRSLGQQWYLSFYIKVVARVKEDRPNIILIDEPGLYLHASGQKDLLSILDAHAGSSGYPILFSTHSPFLITEELFENVRLVVKGVHGTKIVQKLHACPSASKEALTPVLVAIGLGLNDSITNLNEKDNVIVEGIEDVFYLQAFQMCMPKASKKNLNFIFGGGKQKNMGIVGAILKGWGGNVKYLIDNDKDKTGDKNLMKTWNLAEEDILYVQEEAGATVDLLSSDDFKKYILKNEQACIKEGVSNSGYLKSKKLEDKPLKARLFLQSVRSDEVRLDDQSLNNIQKLFDSLEKKFPSQ